MEKKIKIVKNGPYMVYGNIPLDEVSITDGPNGHTYERVKVFPSKEQYALCRCGKSSNMPFCDGTHVDIEFDGTLSISKESRTSETREFYGRNLVLEDTPHLCAFARFCHEGHKNVWSLTEYAKNREEEQEAIIMACNCPAGRLVMKDKKTGIPIEPLFEPSISVLQDVPSNCGGPLWIKGDIPIEDDNGHEYDIRNRVTLCRCGKSNNKPFCDGTHIDIQFLSE